MHSQYLYQTMFCCWIHKEQDRQTKLNAWSHKWTLVQPTRGTQSKKAVCVAAFGSFDQTSNTLSLTLLLFLLIHFFFLQNKSFIFCRRRCGVFCIFVYYSSHSFHDTLIVWKYAWLTCCIFFFFISLFWFLFISCHFYLKWFKNKFYCTYGIDVICWCCVYVLHNVNI